jgi:hypothetical protein
VGDEREREGGQMRGKKERTALIFFSTVLSSATSRRLGFSLALAAASATSLRIMSLMGEATFPFTISKA